MEWYGPSFLVEFCDWLTTSDSIWFEMWLVRRGPSRALSRYCVFWVTASKPVNILWNRSSIIRFDPVSFTFPLQWTSSCPGCSPRRSRSGIFWTAWLTLWISWQPAHSLVYFSKTSLTDGMLRANMGFLLVWSLPGSFRSCPPYCCLCVWCFGHLPLKRLYYPISSSLLCSSATTFKGK